MSNIHTSLRKLAVPIDDLNPDPDNARRHSDANLAAITDSLKRFGQRQPIVVQKDGMVVRAGNGRLTAARALGWKTIAAIVVDESNVDATSFALADNRTSELATWDDEQLKKTLDALKVDGVEPVGWTDDDMVELVKQIEADAPAVEIVEDEAPPVPDDPITKPGDLWQLGRHRVLCGDSSDSPPFDVPQFVFTDPPYGIAFKAMRGGKPIASDESLASAEKVTEAALCNGDFLAGFVCCDWRSIQWVSQVLDRCGVTPKACIVWDKQRGVQNLDRYHKQHEFLVYFGPYGGEKTQCGDVWEFARDFKPDHVTPKPVGLVAKAISTAEMDIVYDPFLGSGTTLIAAEQLGRTCYGIEISPAYCDVIVKRWEKLTGGKATLSDG